MPKRFLILLALSFALIACAIAQTAEPASVYRNEALHLTYRAPSTGWIFVGEDKPVGDRMTSLFRMQKEGHAEIAISVSSENGTGIPGIYVVGPEKLLEAWAKEVEKTADPFGEKPKYPMGIGGKEFARADFKIKGESGKFLSTLCANIAGNILKVTLVGTKPEDLEEMMGILRSGLRFDPDWAAPDAPPAYPPTAGSHPTRVRISQGVSEALIVKKIRPSYPEDARQAHVKGMVVMRVVIGTDGKIKLLWVLSGDPLLVPSSVNAVHQWEYKPYTLNGQPVEVETQITVDYTLRG